MGPRKRRAILLHLSLRFFEALLRCREALAQRLPGCKKPGWDAWCFEQMRLWPWALWRMLAAFFDAVEEACHWPGELRHPIAYMLPSGESGDLLDFRPIFLLSCIYRFWAAVRAEDLRA